MASRRRKKKPKGEPAVPPARQRKFVPIAAALLGLGILTVLVFLNLPGRQAETGNTGEKSRPGATTSARESGMPPPGLVQTGEVAKPSAEAATARPMAIATADRRASVSEAKRGFDVLKGKWLRPDGGYVVEVRSVDDRGKMEASYSNPRPIHVARAEASQDGTATKVFIELRDANYPGSTYNLTYDPQDDQLQGIYYQAALQQSFEVTFVRMK